MDALLDTLSRWRGFRAVVVGDFILDQLVYGNAERMSPEAPVPVLHAQRTEDRPGGASNVCVQLAAMRGSVAALGVVGDDPEAGVLGVALRSAGIDGAGLVRDGSRPTTVKRSLVGLAQHRHPQKMFRVDYESRAPLSEGVEGAILRGFARALESGADVVCIEDYGKGVCTERLCREVIERSRSAGVPVLVDPAARAEFGKYRGATAVTPNRVEAALACGLEPDGQRTAAEHAEIARRLVDELDLSAAIITLDREGALLRERSGAGSEVVPTVAREVYDVTGAGDVVLAALAAGVANGLGWRDAVRLANAAAGLEVEQFGVVPIPVERVHRELLRIGGHGRGKLRTLDEVAVEAAAMRADGKRVVFANGCFDVLHVGHLSLLRRAAEMGDFLVVAINSDGSVRKLKGPGRPVYNERDRSELLGGLECVGAVLVFDEDTPERAIRAIRPDVLVKGAQYSVEEIPGAEFVIANGGRVELVEMVEGRSTTGTVERIRGG